VPATEEVATWVAVFATLGTHTNKSFNLGQRLIGKSPCSLSKIINLVNTKKQIIKRIIN
jgi:hypothetical protein